MKCTTQVFEKNENSTKKVIPKKSILPTVGFELEGFELEGFGLIEKTTKKVIPKNSILSTVGFELEGFGLIEKTTKKVIPKNSILSPNKKKVATIKGRSEINIINIDNTYHQAFQVKNSFIGGTVKNLIWISNNKLRVYLATNSRNYGEFRIDSFPLTGSGTYELTIDDYNTLIAVDKFR